MNTVVIYGDKTDREAYVAQFIASHKTLPYNILSFEEKIKIADVRKIISLISQKISLSQTRLFLLSGEITLDAQHALLKTLEELPENNVIIISCRNQTDVLPTILSRCQIVSLSKTEEKDDSLFYETIQSLLKDSTPSSLFTHSEKIKLLSENDIYMLLSSARKLLLENVGTHNTKELSFLYSFLLIFSTDMHILMNNNVNKQYYYELLMLRLNEAIKIVS